MPTVAARRTNPTKPAKRDGGEAVETALPIGIATELQSLGYVAATSDKIAALSLADQLMVAETIQALKRDQKRPVPVAWIKATAPASWSDNDKLAAFALLPDTEAIQAWNQLADTPLKTRTTLNKLDIDVDILRRCVLVWKNIAPAMIGTHSTPWGSVTCAIVDGTSPRLTLRGATELKSTGLSRLIQRLLLSGMDSPAAGSGQDSEDSEPQQASTAATARPFSPGTLGEPVLSPPAVADAGRRPDERATVSDKPAKRPAAGAMLKPIVPIAAIDVTTNDRQTFAATELQQLADSIREVGILQPLAVRDSGNGRFELVAGERRLRAAKLAGLTSVPVHVVTAADAHQTAVMRLEENLKRVDLDPIEKAAAIRRLQTDHGMKQKEIGKLLGCTQSQVSNMTRLLELPADWQARVSAGAIAPTLARELVTWAKRPQVLTIVGTEFDATTGKPDHDPITATDLRHMICDAIRECTRPMRQADVLPWKAIYPSERHFGKISPTDAQQLDCESIPLLGWDFERAWNVELWDRLNAPAVKARKEKQAKDKSKAGDKGHGKSKANNSESLIQNVISFRAAIAQQLQHKLADRLEKSKDVATILRLSLMFVLLEDDPEFPRRLTGLHQYHPECGTKLLAALGSSPKVIADQLRENALAELRHEFIEIELPLLKAAAAELNCDLLANWQPTADVLDQLTDAGMLECCKEFSLVTGSRAEMLSALQADWQPGIVPAFLAEYLPTI